MRVQQVPNSPYFIHYDDNGYCCISKSRESQEPIPESEMQAFLGAVAMPGYVSSDASTVIADDGTVLVNFTDGIDKLIMYTCYPFGYYSPTNQRYVVQAVLRA